MKLHLRGFLLYLRNCGYQEKIKERLQKEGTLRRMGFFHVFTVDLFSDASLHSMQSVNGRKLLLLRITAVTSLEVTVG